LTRVGRPDSRRPPILTRKIDTAKFEYARRAAGWNSAAQQPAVFLQSNF
jgi:hypothetical protein